MHGAFEVSMPLAPIRSAAREGAMKIGLIILVMALLIIGVALVAATNITRPVHKLMLASEELAQGNLSIQVEAESQDELGKLSESFNSMVGRISALQQESMNETIRAEEAAQQARTLAKESEHASQHLQANVDEMLVAMDRLSNGDLTIHMPVEGSDSIARLRQGFNHTVDTLHDLVQSVRDSIDAAASASSEISSSTEEMSAGAQEQARQTSDAVAAVEEMTKTIMENSSNARQTSDATEQSRQSALTGSDVMKQTVDGMNRISSVVSNSATTIQALGESSAHIGAIITVINDIADQTNLLALNAAIEAARAGEQGRGFAVVADEVRKLAERTTSATQEISDMIKKIQSDTAGAVKSISEGNREVEEGMKLTGRAQSALSEIVSAVSNVSTMISQIAIASEEQSTASEQISRNIEAMNAVTAESATGLRQIAQASEDLNRMTESLHQLIGHFHLRARGSRQAQRAASYDQATQLQHSPAGRATHRVGMGA